MNRFYQLAPPLVCCGWVLVLVNPTLVPLTTADFVSIPNIWIKYIEVGLWNLTLAFSEYVPVTQGGIGIRVCSFLLHSMLLHAWLPHVVSSPTERPLGLPHL